MWIYLLSVVLCAVIFHIYVRYSAFGRAINKINGPPPLPILGNMHLLTSDHSKLWNTVLDNVKMYGPCGKMWFFTNALIITKDPDDIKILLGDKTNITKGSMYQPFKIWSKSGLIVSSGETWHNRRKIITPAFHTNIIKKYMEITAEQGEKFVEFLKTQGNESIHSLIPLMSQVTLSIICESAMGIKFKSMGDKAEAYRKDIDEFFHFVVYRITRPYIQDWMLKLYPYGRKQIEIVKRLSNFSESIIAERRGYHKKTKHQSFQKYMDDVDDTSTEGGKKRLAMLDLLLLAEKEGLIDELGIREEVDTFTAAGYDTTGMGMVYTLLLMAENKDKQDLARAEATRILDASGGKLTMTEMQQMEYIERCIKESLRLFPTAPNITRTISKDIQLKNCLAPAGSDVAITIFATHRDPNHWPDPEKFEPDRFLPEEVQKRHPFAYVPFSGGIRNCIGQKFAMAEMKSLLARILYDFHVEPVSLTKELQFTLHIVLLPNSPQYIKFVKIKK